ncbi:zinc finger MYM-type protein 1-like protein [Tanacetum coccineum]
MNKKRTIDSFYKAIKDVVREPETVTQTQTKNQTNGDNIMEESPRARVKPEINTALNTNEVRLESLIRDLGVRPPLSSYPSNQQDEIRRTYTRLRTYQLVKAHYPLSPCGFHKRRARVEPETNTTLNRNEVRLESLIRDVGVRPPLSSYPSNQQDEIRRTYIRLGPYQLVKAHYPNVIDKQTEQEIMDNRLRLKVTIDSTKWLTLQTCPLRGGTCPLRGGDERPTSLTRGNYLELVQEAIRDEIGTAKFCLIVDEYQDESKKEQMAIVVRFVDRNGYIKEIFLDLVHVKDTNALTLKNEILSSLSYLKLDVQDIQDQVVYFYDKYTYRDIIRSRNKKDDVTVEHHYRVDVFIVAIDSQLQELNNKFNESVLELLHLSVTLDPKKSFNADDICKLITKYYPLDFTEQERIELRLELQHFKLDSDPKLKNVSSLSVLCRGLQETEKSEMYPLIDRLIRLILTLPVSTATSERAFSKMKLVKTRLRSTMSDDFLKNEEEARLAHEKDGSSSAQWSHMVEEDKAPPEVDMGLVDKHLHLAGMRMVDKYMNWLIRVRR